MTNQKFQIARISDASISRIFEDLRKGSSSTNISYNVIGIERALNYSDPNDRTILEGVLSKDGYLVRHANVGIPGFSVHFMRGERAFDTIEINYSHSDQRPSDAAVISLVAKVVENINIVRPSATSNEEAFSEYEAAHRSVLNRLQEVSLGIVEQNQNFLQRRSEEYSAQRQKLEDEYSEKKALLESDITSQRESLKKLESDLEKRTKSLDDRDNTHVRREIRRDLNKILTDRILFRRFSLPSLARELPIHMLFLFVVGISASLVYNFSFSLIEIISDQSTVRPPSQTMIIWAFVKQGLATLTLISSTILYLRWLSKQHQQFVDTEEEVRRYQIDFERASWVVETALEWKRDQSTQIPEPLLTAISRELFALRAKTEAGDQAPIDMLASALLGSASRVKLNTGIAEVEIDGKKLGKAKIEA